MPEPSSKANSVPPCLSPESAPVWARLRNYIRHTERRLLLVVRHDSPRLPRELAPLLAEESGRPFLAATVSDAEPDPLAAAFRAAPGGRFPPRALLSITGAEDLAISAVDDSPAALYEFARRLDLRRDQFLPGGGVVLVWANARVFAALAEHALNFISRAAAVLTLAEAGEKRRLAGFDPSPASLESLRGHHDLPPLPPAAPDDLRAALDAFAELALAGELYRQGGPKIAHGLATFDAARDRIAAGWTAAYRWSGLDAGKDHADSGKDAVCDFARALLVAYPLAGAYLLSLRQHPRERIAWLEAAAAAARLRGDRPGEGNALGNLGLAHADLGDARKAIEFYEQALVVSREIGDRRGEGSDLGNLGLAHADLGDARKAIEFYEQNVVIAREIGDRRGEGNALGNLGNAHADLGDARKAIEFYEQQLVIAREIGDRRGEGNALGNLGSAHADLGDARKAIEFYEQNVVIAREIGDRRGEGNALGNLGNAHADLGDARKAIEFYEQQLVIAREIGDRRGEGNALGNLGSAHADLGDARKAIEFYEQRLVIAREIGDRRGEGNALGNLGLAHAALGDARKAIEFYEQCLVLHRETGNRRGEASDLFNSALQLEKLGQRGEARVRAEQAADIYAAIESPAAGKAREFAERLRGEA